MDKDFPLNFLEHIDLFKKNLISNFTFFLVRISYPFVFKKLGQC